MQHFVSRVRLDGGLRGFFRKASVEGGQALGSGLGELERRINRAKSNGV